MGYSSCGRSGAPGRKNKKRPGTQGRDAREARDDTVMVSEIVADADPKEAAQQIVKRCVDVDAGVGLR
ncbi:hypothetical protein GCM10009087_40100 [Sphingomonas oligophenolica]